jgi:acyl-[acyl-carrier-protein] desaturase
VPDPQDLDLLRELEPVVEKYMNRHLSVHKPWNPHDYIPWSDGKNFYALGGQDWEPGQSVLTDVAQVAMVQNLMTEDNLPSYHREIAMSFGMDGAWGQWVNRWTAEENRHGIALRDYLLVTRAVDPVELEKLRLEVVNRGFSRATCWPPTCSTRSYTSRSRNSPPVFHTATPGRRATSRSPINCWPRSRRTKTCT